MAEYIFDPAWEQERERIGSGEYLLDPLTTEILAGVGVGDRWQCLEIGAGGGTIASWLCERVGPSGHVLATDLDTRFVERLDHSNLEVRQHDVTAGPLDERTFDLIHARLVLEHVPSRSEVVTQLVATLRPGGWLVLEDIDATDQSYVPAEKFLEYPKDEIHGPARLGKALMSVLDDLGVVDLTYGRELPGELLKNGLEEVDARHQAQLVTGGSARARFSLLLMEFLREQILATELLSEEEFQFVWDRHHDPSHHWMSVPVCSAWGRKPGEPTIG